MEDQSTLQYIIKDLLKQLLQLLFSNPQSTDGTVEAIDKRS